ncbi:MAG: hypothetical protein GXP28_04915, partial [Planctomycetes bacterium]|nr:hypothetical protein [Planctomycetota bacterium]
MATPHFYICWILLLAGLGQAQKAQALEHVLVNLEGQQRRLSGKVVTEDDYGTMLLETDEGAMWHLDARTIRTRSSDS